MGNEKSSLSGIEIEEEAIEVSNFWSQHSATIFESNAVNELTVFIENSTVFTRDNLWSSQTPLERFTRNLMVHRHPCIVKYVGSWHKNSKFYLAVENVTPLHYILPSLNNIQISVGLYSILKSLLFLHENASASHNNICISSIYVTKDGTWKLGGMEYLCKYNELTFKYLNQRKTCRYNKAIDENEGKHFNTGRKDFVDIYAYGVLANEVLKSEDSDGILSTKNFSDYCKNELQNCDISKRPNLVSILSHPFFSQDFIMIYSFLMELPLKTDIEKQEFFQSLYGKLKTFDENLVANQLSGFLLSRMVLSNVCAQKELVPYLLTPQTDASNEHKNCLFKVETFQEYICPKLIEIFKVHEVQLRLLLLLYLPKFVQVFTKEELQGSILPELLVGIKDTSDELVTATLKALADLVPILGSEIVIGGKRAKLFNDGRPNKSINISKLKPKNSTSVNSVAQETVVNSVLTDLNNLNVLTERPRPDGEEGTDRREVLLSNNEDDENDLEKWDEWDPNEVNEDTENGDEDNINIEIQNILQAQTRKMSLSTLQMNSAQNIPFNKTSVADISELDIKSQVRFRDEDVDFFEDMEPIINNSNKFLIDEQNDIKLEKEINTKLSFNTTENSEEGWGDAWD